MTEFGQSPKSPSSAAQRGRPFRDPSSVFKSCTSVPPVAFICARTYSCSIVRPERRVFLAGASPVRVSAGWSVESPRKRAEQASGPRQSVNATASSNYQPKGVRNEILKPKDSNSCTGLDFVGRYFSCTDATSRTKWTGASKTRAGTADKERNRYHGGCTEV